MMQKSVAFDGLSATGFCTAHVIDLVPASFCRTDVRLRNTPCLGRFERYRLTGPREAIRRRDRDSEPIREIARGYYDTVTRQSLLVQ
jgi:hypothetical protein